MWTASETNNKTKCASSVSVCCGVIMPKNWVSRKISTYIDRWWYGRNTTVLPPSKSTGQARNNNSVPSLLLPVHTKLCHEQRDMLKGCNFDSQCNEVSTFTDSLTVAAALCCTAAALYKKHNNTTYDTTNTDRCSYLSLLFLHTHTNSKLSDCAVEPLSWWVTCLSAERRACR